MLERSARSAGPISFLPGGGKILDGVGCVEYNDSYNYFTLSLKSV